MADEQVGSVSVRIELDDSGVESEGRRLGRRVEQAVDRGGRGVGDDLVKRLRANLERGRAAVAEANALGQRIAAAVENGGEDIGEDLVDDLRRNLERGRRAYAEARRLGDRVAKAVDDGAADVGEGIVDDLAVQLEQGGRAIRAARRLGDQVADAVADGGNPGERVVNELAVQLERSGRATVAARRLGDRIGDAIESGARGRRLSFVDTLVRSLDRARPHVDDVRDSLSRLSPRRLAAGVTRLAARFLILARASALAAAGIGILAGGLAGLQLGAAIAPVIGILAALPATIFTAVAALSTLRVALSGVGDAFGAALTGNADQFAKALEKISPPARRIAVELRGLRPEFDALRAAVQGAFFGPLEGQLTRLVRVLGGPLTVNMADIAAQFGRLTLAFTRFAASASGVRVIGAAFDSLRNTLAAIETGTVTRLLDAVARFTVASLPAFEGLGEAIDNALARFTRFLNAAVRSGDALSWVTTAVGIFRQLTRVAGDLVGIVVGIGRAAASLGGGPLQVLESVTSTINQFVNSLAGQRTIAAVLGTLQQAVNTFGRALRNLAPGAADVFRQLGEAVGVLDRSGALDALAMSAGQILAALAPLLPIVSRVASVFASALAPVVSAVATAFELIVGALAPVINQLLTRLEPILPVVSDALSQVAIAIGQTLAAALQEVGPALADLAPVLSAVATAFASIVGALAPVINQLLTRLEPILPVIFDALSQVAIAIGQTLAAALQEAGPALADLVGAVLELATAFLPVLPSILPLVPIIARLAAQLLALSVQVLVPLIRGLAQLVRFLLPVQIAFNTVVVAVVRFVAAVAGRLITAFTRFLARIRSVGDVVSSFTQLNNELSRTIGGPVVRALQSAQRFIARVGAALIGPLRNGLKIALTVARQVAAFFADRVIAVLTSVRNNAIRLAAAFTGTVRHALDVARETAQRMLAFFRTLPGRIRSAFSGTSTLLRGAGRNLIDGLKNGVTDAMKGISSWVKSRIVDPIIKAVKRFFGIKSPSRVFAGIGGYLVKGLIEGLSQMNVRAVITKVFGGMPGALVALMNKGLVAFDALSGKAIDALAGLGPELAGLLGGAGGFAAGLAFARAQVGKPYVWGGVGPGGFDCSGYLGAIEGVITGVNPYRRRFTSASFSGARRVGNWIRNLPSPFMLGALPHSHVAGTLLGTNVESSGSRGPHVGRSARGAFDRMFRYRYGLIPRVARLLTAGPKRRSDKEGEQFDLGGIARGIGHMSKATLKPERVLSPIQTRAFEHLTRAISGFRGRLVPQVIASLGAATGPGWMAPTASPALSGKAMRGLEALAGGAGRSAPVVNQHVTINEVGDANATAHRVMHRMAMAYGGDV